MSTKKISSDAPKAQDRLDDLLHGFEFWKESKATSLDLTTADEMFIRWVEYGKEESA